MRYPAQHKQQIREKIVKAAARRFCSRGSERAGIGDLMRDLRLTHGGFYRHFLSKEELFVAAFEQGLRQLTHHADCAVKHAPKGGELKALIDGYLSLEHCDDAAGGCPIAALTTEIARRPTKVRGALFNLLIKHIGSEAKYMSGANDEERTRKVRFLFSGMAGTLNVARLIVDTGQRKKFLEDARKFYFDAVRQ
jgi:TetR/AcrR family transcriptional repressor of nem operon